MSTDVVISPRKNFSIERSYRIYNDTTGAYIEVRPDRDGLGLIEIVQEKTIITVEPQMLGLLSKVLFDCNQNLDKN